MSRARIKRRKGWSALVIILLLMVIGGGLLFVHQLEQREREEEARYAAEHDGYPQRMTLSWEGRDYILRDRLDTILMIGLDKTTETMVEGSIFNNEQADFLFLMLVDHADQSFCALHINRDTMTEIQRYGLGGVKLHSTVAQIALSHTYGKGRESCRYTAEAVSTLLHSVPVDHYMSLPMDAIPILNDLVGGVVVQVTDDFSHIDPKLEMGKDVRLRGKQALTFVRARMSMKDPTNINRMARQKEYLNGFYRQVQEKLADDDGFAARVASKLADYMVSDLSTESMANLVERLKGYRFTGIYSLEGEAVVGEQYMEFYPDPDALTALVVKLFFEPLET